jgi:tungstate transport system substrate-binding protein
MIRWWMSGLCALLMACGHATAPGILATTTSVANSGLLDRLLPAYDRPIRVSPVGSGVALGLLARGDADVALTHAPEQEAKALQEHPAWWYRKILYNDFLIVGPPDDPAHVRGSEDAVAAMRRIARAGATFISRGDSSGTHERERKLWDLAGETPAPPHLVVAGAGMGQTLRVASTTDAYTLTDRGTFEALSGSIRSLVLYAGDGRLLNTYAVIADPRNAAGLRFARWLVEGAGRGTLEEIVPRQVKGFSIWPKGSRQDTPDALPE